MIVVKSDEKSEFENINHNVTRSAVFMRQLPDTNVTTGFCFLNPTEPFFYLYTQNVGRDTSFCFGYLEPFIFLQTEVLNEVEPRIHA